MIIRPHTMFITLSILSFILVRMSDTMVVIPNHHVRDAMETPRINRKALPLGSDA